MSDPNHSQRAFQEVGGQTATAGDSGGPADSPGASPAAEAAPAQSRDGARSTTAASLSPSALDLTGSPGGSGTVAASSSAYGTTRPSGARVPRWLGKRVGRFRLVALLGRGSWGRVFEAEDTVLRRRVALKLIPVTPKEGQRPVDFDRVIREARAAAALEHPNVVQVYEVGQYKDLFFIAMELAEGGSLEDMIRATGPIDAVRACHLIAEAAEALAMAHNCGIVHRDVKPANLLLGRNGRCKVSDFGLATMEDPSDPHQSMRVAGTSYYVAPEVIRGNSASGRSDIYSLGATLYHMLAGRRPFEGGSRSEVLRAHVDQDPPDLRELRPDLDPKLAEVVERAMDKDPSKRFAAIDQFGKALRLFTIPSGAHVPAPQPQRQARPAPRRPQLSAPRMRGWLAIAGGLAAVALIVAVTLFLRGPDGGASVVSAGTGTAPNQPQPRQDSFEAMPSASALPVLKRHTFQLDTRQWNDQPRTVYVAGEFNEWSTITHPMHDPEGDHVWTLQVELPPGVHAYKFIIDGQRWMTDPVADISLETADGHGGRNSGVRISG